MTRIEPLVSPPVPSTDIYRRLRLLGYDTVGLIEGETPPGSVEEARSAGLKVIRWVIGRAGRDSPQGCKLLETGGEGPKARLLLVPLKSDVKALRKCVDGGQNRLDAIGVSFGEVRLAFREDPLLFYESISSFRRACAGSRVGVVPYSEARGAPECVPPTAYEALSNILTGREDPAKSSASRSLLSTLEAHSA